MAIKIYSPNKTEVRGGPGEGTKNNPFYWYGKLADPANTGVTGTFNNYDSFDEMNYTADPIWVRVYLDAETTYQIGQTIYNDFNIYDDEFNSVAKAGSNEREIAGVNCYYSIDFTPEKSGVYFLSVGVINGYPEEFRVACSPSPNSVDAVPDYYDYQLTSKGFDNIGKYHGFNNLAEAGLQPLTDDKLLCRFTFDGENPLQSTNGKYTLTSNYPSTFSFVDSKAKSLGKGVSFIRYGLNSNVTGASFLNDTDFTIMSYCRINKLPEWNACGGGHYDLFQFGSMWGNFASISNSDDLPYVSIGASQDDNDYSNPRDIWRSSIPYPINEWWHFCYVYHNGTIYYFQDGKLALKVTPSFTIKEYRQDTYTLKIGNPSGVSNSLAYDAVWSFDDIRIYKRAVFLEDFTPPLK